MTKYQAPKGTYDVLPPDSAWWSDARRTFDDLCSEFGFGLVMTPLFEDTDVFARGVGADTEVVQKQMYTFTDKGGRSVTLRPEQTASIVRAVIQAGGVSGHFKGAYWGEMFRYERPQKGRTRQFMQAGVEYVGSVSPEADVEVIELGYRLLERLSVPSIDIRLNSIGDPEDRTRYDDALRTFLRERFDELSDDAKARIETNPMRVLDSKADTAVMEDAPTPRGYLGEPARQHFDAVMAGLDDLNLPFTVDDTLVRGLDYYTRTVWEYVPTGYEAAQSSVGGGGRYDGLFERMGGKPTPAVGLAMGVDRILLASNAHTLEPLLDAYIVVADETFRAAARQFTSQLRSSGLRVDMGTAQRSVKAQFKEADRARAAHAVVVGSEWVDGTVSVKDLSTGDQQITPIKDIATWLRA